MGRAGQGLGLRVEHDRVEGCGRSMAGFRALGGAGLRVVGGAGQGLGLGRSGQGCEWGLGLWAEHGGRSTAGGVVTDLPSARLMPLKSG